jgi:hypothetical protein
LVSIVTKAQTNTINLEKESAIPGDPILLERKEAQIILFNDQNPAFK